MKRKVISTLTTKTTKLDGKFFRLFTPTWYRFLECCHEALFILLFVRNAKMHFYDY